nr:protein kinase [bacterium]
MGQGDLFAGAPEPGTVVGGKYRLERMISEGGGGVVWEALEPEGRKVALKFLKWSPLKSRKVAAERFKNEFAILKSLSHPNISQIYDFGLDPASDLYFFTSELLTAGDLKAVIGEPIPALEELLLQGLRALEYLRGNKLLHLDIKPQNLLLRHDGGHPEMAMIDFGLATFRAPDKPGGTANYMPPEMIVRRLDLADDSGNYPPADHRSDLYSLGVTFYYLLTGIQPFCVLTEDGKRIDSLATLHRHLEYDPPPPSKHRREIPAYIDRVIMKLMARHPDDRYPSAIVAAQALQYSSPAAHAPESARTLLAYLPKEGKLVGRKSERAIIEESLRLIASGAAHAAPVICIAGGRGTGRSRLLAAAKPFAQQLEMDVTVVGEAGIQAAINTVDSSRAPSHLILMDDAERALDGNGAADSFRALIRRLRLQQRLKEAPGPKIAFIFSLNTDRLDLKRAALEANIDDTICHSIELANFTVAEVSEYLAALLGEAPDSAVAEQLARCTDGNPLFITEHLEEMIAKGRLFSLAGRPDAKTLKAIGVD